MYVDSMINPETLIQPRSFVGLMTLYESNYIRLLQLVPALDEFSGRRVSIVDGDCDLHLELLERSRYTATLSMTYEICEDEKVIYDPNLKLRVYFDGCLAEAMSVSEIHVHQVLRDIAKRHHVELDSRWARNVMLNKWLEYCCDKGHVIRSDSALAVL